MRHHIIHGDVGLHEQAKGGNAGVLPEVEIDVVIQQNRAPIGGVVVKHGDDGKGCGALGGFQRDGFGGIGDSRSQHQGFGDNHAFSGIQLRPRIFDVVANPGIGALTIGDITVSGNDFGLTVDRDPLVSRLRFVRRTIEGNHVNIGVVVGDDVVYFWPGVGFGDHGRIDAAKDAIGRGAGWRHVNVGLQCLV